MWRTCYQSPRYSGQTQSDFFFLKTGTGKNCCDNTKSASVSSYLEVESEVCKRKKPAVTSYLKVQVRKVCAISSLHDISSSAVTSTRNWSLG
jgi:hypothetical protein